ncbi:diacylglycerol O-acyltransferase 1 [Lithohypha guttulata]|nr:diacylglycerol O-acyltransferase 1 [Lithohypha guttulata]
MDSEPANPEERAQQDLPPKSYADAAHEAVNGDDDYKHSNGHSTPNKEAVWNLDENKIVYEKYKDGEGSVLVSVKPDPSYEENLKHNKATAPRSRGSSTSENKKLQDTPKPQLQAGRRAGAGWERSAKYIFGYHPHGIISHGAFAAFGTEALGFSDLFPGITNTLLTLDSNFRIPFYRDYALALGLGSVSKESIENLLSRGGINNEGMGRAVTVVVGGARESLDAQPHHLKLVLNSRKGFVKIAIRQGADLVPVLAFGENELYEQVDSQEHPFIHKFQMIVKKAMGFTVPLFHARGIFNYDVGLMPYRRAMNIVVGKPIVVKQQGGAGSDGKVDEAYLDEVHKAYVDELINMWNEHKDTFAKDRLGELEVVE